MLQPTPSGGPNDTASRRGPGGLVAAPRSRFDVTVPPAGYHWWYLDGVSACGRYGLTVIAFIGSVFSPYYAWSGRKLPLNHCAMNVVLYGASGHRWAMTERSARSVRQSETALTIGPSAIHWDGDDLVVTVDEWTVPIPSRLRGTIRLSPITRPGTVFALDDGDRHGWWPVAPTARIAVDFTAPALRWEGSGYHDVNAGSEPLEDGFRMWDWSQADLPNGDGTVILYNAECRRGGALSLALLIGADGGVEPLPPPERVSLPRSSWQVVRQTRSEDPQSTRVVATWEDSPFYTRSRVQQTLLGHTVTAMHESLMLDRFANPIIRMMLPFRMPRLG